MRLRLRKAKPVQVTGTEGLSPERVAEIEAMAMKLRMEGRKRGQLSHDVGEEVKANGKPWPAVIEDFNLGTSTVPATYEGLLAMVTSWDSLLLDEELQAFRNVVDAMLPMGLMKQEAVRRLRAQQEAEWDHMREHHPDEWNQSQGWMV